MGRRGAESAESAERRLAKTEIESAREASSAVASPLGPDLCALRASAANLGLHGAVRAPIGTCSSPDRRADRGQTAARVASGRQGAKAAPVNWNGRDRQRG